MRRPLEDLFADPVQHHPQRRSMGVLLHIEIETEHPAVTSEDLAARTFNTSREIILELAFNEGEKFDADTTTLGLLSHRTPGTRGLQPVRCVLRLTHLSPTFPDQSFTTHDPHDNQSNVRFTSTVAFGGVLVSLDDDTSHEQTVSESLGGTDRVIHAAVVMTKTSIVAPSPGMIPHVVRSVMLKWKSGAVRGFQCKVAPWSARVS